MGERFGKCWLALISEDPSIFGTSGCLWDRQEDGSVVGGAGMAVAG